MTREPAPARHRWTALLAAVVVTLGVLVAAPAAAAPASPSGLTPQGSSTVENPVLQWDRVAGAASYDVELSTSASFDTTLYKVTTVNRRATPTAQLPAAALFWRVRARTAGGVSNWATAGFTRDVGSGPAPLAPEDGALLQQPDQPPLLMWRSVPGATGYSVEIDGADADWVDTTTYTTKTTSLVVPDPQENGVYWWRVRAQLGAGISTLPSQERSYVVGALPVIGPSDLAATDTITRPLEGAAVSDVVFDWAPVKGAVSYDLRVATDNSFNDVIDHPVVLGTRYSPTITYNVDDYWWQVRARNVFGKAQEWNDVRIRTFRRDWVDRPSLTYPADTVSPSVGDDMYYQWTPVHLATHYRLDVGTDRSFSPGSFHSCVVTQTTYTPFFAKSPQTDACAPSPGVTYFWRVKALDGPRNPEVNGVYSTIRTFVYNPGQVPLIAPVDGATVDTPTLRWAPVAGAEKYLVTMRYGGTTTTATTYSTSWTYTGAKQLDAGKGPFSWTVQGISVTGAKTALSLGPWRSFSLTGADPSTGAAALTPLTPAPAASSVRFPSLTWEPQPGAAYYRVYAGSAGSGFFSALGPSTNPDKYPYPAATDLSSSYFDAGSYDWFVKAYSATGTEIGSGSSSRFRIRDLAPVSGQRVALSGAGLDSGGTPCTSSLSVGSAVCEDLTATPVLDWSPVEDAGVYLVYVSRNRYFQNMVYGTLSDPKSLPQTYNSRWTPTETLPDSQAGVAYYWYVRPCKTASHCSPDPTEATHAFAKKSNRVEPYAPVTASASPEPAPARFDPAAAQATVADDVQFSWDDYLSVNQDEPGSHQVRSHRDPQTGERPDQAARGYHLQVGTTPAFSTVVDDVTVDQTTYTAWDTTYPEGQLYWRIQAVDGSGNGLSWTDAMPFTKESPRVSLMSPDGTSTPIDGTQPFRWSARAYAAGYDLEVYKNADTTGSSANRVLTANSVKQAAYTMAAPLPAADTPYVWRVRRVDATSRKGAWSDWGTFRVGGSAPTLIAPAASGVVNGSDALFTWQAGATAASYKFERRRSGDTYALESVTTVSPQWATTKVITDGSWEWRVTSLDAAGKPISSTGWRPFSVRTVTVDTTRPTVTSKTPTTRAYRTANFTARFSERVTGVSARSMRIYRTGYATALRAKVTLSGDGRRATLNPSRNLKVGKYYTVKLSSTIKDRAGNSLAATPWRVRAR